MSVLTRALIAFILFIAPDFASAHVPFTGAEGFPGGFLHPLFVPPHALAILATGLLIAGQIRHWLCISAFAVGLAAGSIAIAAAYVPSYAGETVLALAIAIGASVAFGKPILEIFTGLLAATTGLAIALDSPPEAILLRDAIAMQLGTFLGATAFALGVVEAASRLKRDWQRIGGRIIGSWIAATAILVLASRLVR